MHRIEEEQLPGRFATALFKAGIFHVEDLADMTRRELLAVHGIGKRGLKIIEAYLSLKGRGLTADVNPPESQQGRGENQ